MKEFDIASPEPQGEPIVFKLAKEEFRCIPELPGVAVIELYRDDGTTPLIARIANFIEACLIEEDVPKFRRLLKSWRHRIRADDLAQVLTWLVEQYGARPTEPAAFWGDGRQTSGSGSTAGAQPVTSIPDASQPKDSLI